jgi:hypothetical protein
LNKVFDNRWRKIIILTNFSDIYKSKQKIKFKITEIFKNQIKCTCFAGSKNSFITTFRVTTALCIFAFNINVVNHFRKSASK